MKKPLTLILSGFAIGFATNNLIKAYLNSDNPVFIDNKLHLNTIPSQIKVDSTDYIVQPDTVNVENYNLIKKSNQSTSKNQTMMETVYFNSTK